MSNRRSEMVENPMLSYAEAGEFCRSGLGKRDGAESAYAQTERRLYSLPHVRAYAAELRDEIDELSRLGVDGLRAHSLSLVQLIRPGMRLEPEEVHEAQMKLLRVKLAANEREVKRMELALSSVKNDPYYLALELRYFNEQKDASIAERLVCDPATVRRNLKRLVNALSVRLSGVG